METAWLDNVAHSATLLQPAPRRFVFARKHLAIHVARALAVSVYPNKRGRRLIAHHRFAVVIRLWVSYTPVNGNERRVGVYGLPMTRPHHRRPRRRG